ncbi:hypothetical protein SAMD00019534_105150 [Acytostelium subglobosum LB1]|uniref:hypothetical protein n=1 Tax=Acytostelium subglobosum LB1 TaxID=1410327 RepID=UPI00064494C4|nr:hypothetical protein SAMD00019534_105150 [Acytostelium subglobosum LB1]GAM27340.1 hypothetical protein SAMD00019534_105150 [Acytostelium subglobosum LB1]|eukprot:XP_012749807.1 hypothetical protein SAMD00019534_105150 [Acytostelium subglobosum LB1]
MKRDFRTAYLNTLGFKGGQLKTSLEAIFEHRVVDLNKLKKICNLFEMPSQYRGRVWKILLGVASSYQETSDFIHEQRTIEYEDLKHAVCLVRRGNLPDNFFQRWKDVLNEYSIDSDEQVVLDARDSAASSLAIIYHVKEQYFNFQNGLYFITDADQGNMSSSSSQRSMSPSSNDGMTSFDSSNNNSNSKGTTNSSSMSHTMVNPPTNTTSSSTSTTIPNNNTLPTPLVKEDNNNIDNQDIDRRIEQLLSEYSGSQPNSLVATSSGGGSGKDDYGMQFEEHLKAIAEVFCYVCDTEVDAFWCFNSFLNRSLKQYGHKDIGIYHQINILSRLLELYEKSLWDHFHLHNVHVEQFSTKWFKTYFTCFLPTTYLYRVWDRIIGVSLDYMAFIALSILQTKRQGILEKTSAADILNYTMNLSIKDLNIDAILEKSLEYYTNSE